MTDAQQVWVISIVSALVGGLSGAIASFYFAKRLNKTSLAMEFLKQLMAQYAEGSQLEALLRQRVYGGLKSLSPSEMDLIFKFGGLYEAASHAYMTNIVDRALLDSINMRPVFSRFTTLVRGFADSYSELAREFGQWEYLVKFTQKLTKRQTN